MAALATPDDPEGPRPPCWRTEQLERALGDLVRLVNRCSCQCACDYDAALDRAEALLGLPVGGEPQ